MSREILETEGVEEEAEKWVGIGLMAVLPRDQEGTSCHPPMGVQTIFQSGFDLFDLSQLYKIFIKLF